MSRIFNSKGIAITDDQGRPLKPKRRWALPEAAETYRALADGLSDMVEAGRLNEVDIPDDYEWLVAMLAKIAELDPADPKCRHGDTAGGICLNCGYDPMDEDEPC